MTVGGTIDGVLVQWGERLFYPGNRSVRSGKPTRSSLRRRAAAVRSRIQATVVRRAPQVMVKVTGGGRGMKAIAAHFRYISKSGRLPFEDDRGIVREGREALGDLVDQWRLGGSRIEESSKRREAYNVILSMPTGIDSHYVLRAAREFAQAELADHRYVMVLHDHQANPHVHISVRAESRHGRRLNPRKADLQRWRETFATKLRGWGIDAEATRQATRGQIRNYGTLWQVKAGGEGRLRTPFPPRKSGQQAERTRMEAVVAWARIAQGLSGSESLEDRALARDVDRYMRATPFALAYGQRLEKKVGRSATAAGPDHLPSPAAPAPGRTPTR